MSSLPRPLLTVAPLLALPSAGAAEPRVALSLLAGACGALSRDTGDSVVDDWLVDVLWSALGEEALPVEPGFATPLHTFSSPLFGFPFGFGLRSCAKAGLDAAIIAAAAALKSAIGLMLGLLLGS